MSLMRKKNACKNRNRIVGLIKLFLTFADRNSESIKIIFAIRNCLFIFLIMLICEFYLLCIIWSYHARNLGVHFIFVLILLPDSTYNYHILVIV